MLFAQHLCHLFMHGAYALLCLAHLARCLLTQLFGAFAERHPLQLSDQSLQPVDFAGVRHHPQCRRLYSANWRIVVCCSCSSALSRAFSSGCEVSKPLLYSRLYPQTRLFRPLRMLVG